MGNFEKFREDYPVFRYRDYHIIKEDDGVTLAYDFEIDGLCTFRPTNKIFTNNLDIINACDCAAARRIAFLLGMTELVSYIKPTCSPKIIVECGYLSQDEKQFWINLYMSGLGEFFYRNGINPEGSVFEIECAPAGADGDFTIKSAGINIIPVGGGKDSAVSASLLSDFADKNMFFTVNDQQARTDTVTAAGYDGSRIIRTKRTISPELLDLNKRGFLNGHTPFSAIVAFLSLYCGVLVGAENIVLSNEGSANESTVLGLSVNHQYSKSYEFERDFTAYVKNLGLPVNYFSLLRPFSELQIAGMFSRLPQYHKVFRSCNAGSKKNVWCNSCGKCLFVFIVLSAFLTPSEVTEIFGENLLCKEELTAEFDGLCGFTPEKPFECVGTREEVAAALALAVEKYDGELPLLLKRYALREKADVAAARELLKKFNTEHNVPEKFLYKVKEMHEIVSSL